MNAQQLKEYIADNGYVEQILRAINCHHIQYHSSGYWTCANKDGDNKSAIIIYNNENLNCTNYTRKITQNDRAADIIDLVCFNNECNFVEGLKFICNIIGIEYYHDFEEDLPDSLMITQLLKDMRSDEEKRDRTPLKPIPECILTYYRDYVNDLFKDDNISYETQQEFHVGYDELSNRITIPIYSELGDLVGVKGRLFKKNLSDDDVKYIYLEPCPKGRILYGLNKTIDHIKQEGYVIVVESEKAVMQLWTYGFRNAVSTGGKTISSTQVDMLSRLGVDILFAFDQDVSEEELIDISKKFIDNIPIYALMDKDNILKEKESPSDNPDNFCKLLNNNKIKLK